jgi:hypothetical protein
MGGWMVLNTGLDTVVKRKILKLCQDSEPLIIQPVSQRYTYLLILFVPTGT